MFDRRFQIDKVHLSGYSVAMRNGVRMFHIGLGVLVTILVVFPLQNVTADSITRTELRAGSRSDERLAIAFKLGLSEFPIKCSGIVVKKLSDDLLDIRHQRFIVKLATGQTLLIAHNIDLSDRVTKLRINDRITIRGEYIWNSQGGLIHLTHRDPDGIGFHGWIKHRGRKYE